MQFLTFVPERQHTNAHATFFNIAWLLASMSRFLYMSCVIFHKRCAAHVYFSIFIRCKPGNSPCPRDHDLRDYGWPVTFLGYCI
ncbi:hypothetical protein BDZ91DRAFT_741248 [Kalaharituber pfeilii]|nr:hypothetical protein BDZ91DRAFT_741248 [Kalaharituber pfeilii]